MQGGISGAISKSKRATGIWCSEAGGVGEAKHPAGAKSQPTIEATRPVVQRLKEPLSGVSRSKQECAKARI